LTKKIKFEVKCTDALIEIAGKRFLGVSKKRCMIPSGVTVTVIDGPLEVSDSEERIVSVLAVRHVGTDGELHEGWVPAQALEDSV
jgi:hypothetical protein